MAQIFLVGIAETAEQNKTKRCLLWLLLKMKLETEIYQSFGKKSGKRPTCCCNNYLKPIIHVKQVQALTKRAIGSQWFEAIL